MRSSFLERRILLNTSTTLSSTQLQIDAVMKTFSEEVANPLSIAAMVGGGFAFRGTNLLFSRLASPLLTESGVLTRTLAQTTIRGLSLGAEVATFRNISHGSSHVFEGKGFATDYLSFGILKGVGHVARGSSPVMTHFLQSTGMVAGQNLAYGFGFAIQPQGSLIEQLAYAEATNIKLGLGMSLVGIAAPGFSRFERSMDLQSSVLSFRSSPRLFSRSIESAQVLPVMGSQGISDNTRVNGPVLEVLGRDTATTNVPKQGFMGRMENPANGFTSFVMPDGTQVVWLGSPDAYPGILGERLAHTWNNALGTVLVANPKADALGLIVMHGAMKNHWAPDAQEGGVLWRGLGGMMAFPKSVPPSRELVPLLGALGVPHTGEGFRIETLSPEQQAWVNLLGAAEKTNGKAMGMTPKWQFIDQALEGVGIPARTGLGGMKSVVLHAPNDSAKEQAVRMMGRVANTLGIYISGGDEGTARGPWTDMFAEEAPMNMAGSKNSHFLVRGQYPSAHTARGVFSGIKNYIEFTDATIDQNPIFFQGAGGVGRNVIEFALQEGYKIGGVTEIIASDLVAVRELAVKAGHQDVPFIWDRQSAREALDAATFAKQEKIAEEAGLLVADGLVGAVRLAHQRLGSNIPVLSLNATSHQVSIDNLQAFQEVGIQAVIGGANNMLELDAHGSYLPAAQRALDLGIFVPNDSALNRMGATIVLANALGINEQQAGQLAEYVGAYSRREHQYGFLRGIPPQLYSDKSAWRSWNDLLDQGRAIGGRSNIP